MDRDLTKEERAALIPTGRQERISYIRIRFFRTDWVGKPVTDRVELLADEIGLAEGTLWKHYKNHFKNEYEAEMRSYLELKEKQAKEEGYNKVVIQQIDRTGDDLTLTFTSAVKLTSGFLNFKMKKHNYLLGKMEEVLERRGGFDHLTIEDKLQLKALEKELDEDIMNLRSFILPDKLVQYMNAIQHHQGLGIVDPTKPQKATYTFRQLLNMAIADIQFTKPTLDKVAETIEATYSEMALPEISGRTVEYKPPASHTATEESEEDS